MIESFLNFFFWPLVFSLLWNICSCHFVYFSIGCLPDPLLTCLSFNMLDISYFSVICATNNSLHSVFSHSLWCHVIKEAFNCNVVNLFIISLMISFFFLFVSFLRNLFLSWSYECISVYDLLKRIIVLLFQI